MLEDVFGHGNEGCVLPGQPEARAAEAALAAGGLLFTEAEIAEFNAIARECGEPEWDPRRLSPGVSRLTEHETQAAKPALLRSGGPPPALFGAVRKELTRRLFPL